MSVKFGVGGTFFLGGRKLFFWVVGNFLGVRNILVVGVRLHVFMLQGLGLERASRVRGGKGLKG